MTVVTEDEFKSVVSMEQLTKEEETDNPYHYESYYDSAHNLLAIATYHSLKLPVFEVFVDF